jgi:hypothetical protein
VTQFQFLIIGCLIAFMLIAFRQWLGARAALYSLLLAFGFALGIYAGQATCGKTPAAQTRMQVQT